MATKNKTVVTAEPGKQEVTITREFEAPRELVYRAHIDPDLYVRWLGPHGYEMVLETFEPYSGGRYRYIYEHPVEPPPADSPDPVLEFTQRCTDVLEMYVRRHPELWLWMHRRWRDA